MRDQGGPTKRRFLRIVGLLVLSHFSGACGQILGVDEYRVANSPEGDAGDAYYPLPALPDKQRRVACRQCAEMQCAGELRVCNENPRCREMLDCSGGCSDPACLAHCADIHAPSPDFDVYFNCVFLTRSEASRPYGKCTDKCTDSGNFGCLSNFPWDQRTTLANVLIVDNLATFQTPLTTLVGVSVASCTDQGGLLGRGGALGCHSPDVPVDDYGNATVPFVVGDDAFEITGGGGEQHRYYPRPIAGPGPVRLVTWGRFGFGVVTSGIRIDSDQGVVVFFQHDCLGIGVPATVTLDQFPSNAAYYPNAEGVFSQQPGSGGTGFLVNVDAGTGSVGLSSTASGTLVSRRTIRVAAGWITEVDLYPRGRGEM